MASGLLAHCPAAAAKTGSKPAAQTARSTGRMLRTWTWKNILVESCPKSEMQSRHRRGQEERGREILFEFDVANREWGMGGGGRRGARVGRLK